MLLVVARVVAVVVVIEEGVEKGGEKKAASHAFILFVTIEEKTKMARFAKRGMLEGCRRWLGLCITSRHMPQVVLIGCTSPSRPQVVRAVHHQYATFEQWPRADYSFHGVRVRTLYTANENHLRHDC